MKLITLHESDWKLSKIDSIVKEGIFSSRAEVYRSGALLMILMNEAQKLAKLDRLDSELFGREIHMCLESLRQKKYGIMSEKLKEISDTLRLRAIISPLLDGSDKESFETMSNGIKKYADTVARFNQFDQTTKERMINDLKRDLSAIQYYLEETEGKMMKESKYYEKEKYVTAKRLVYHGHRQLGKVKVTRIEKPSKRSSYIIKWANKVVEARSPSRTEEIVVS